MTQAEAMTQFAADEDVSFFLEDIGKLDDMASVTAREMLDCTDKLLESGYEHKVVAATLAKLIDEVHRAIHGTG